MARAPMRFRREEKPGRAEVLRPVLDLVVLTPVDLAAVGLSFLLRIVILCLSQGSHHTPKPSAAPLSLK